MFWRGWFFAPVLIIGLLVAGGIGAAVAHHGWDDDDRGPRVVQVTSPASGTGTTTTPQVVEIHDRGWGHHRGGFFPGFFIFPILFFFLIFWLVGGLFRGGGWRGGPGGPGGAWRGHWNDRFEEWHRDQHQGDVPPAPPAASA